MLEVHVMYIYVQYILIDLVKLWKDSANSSNKDSELRNYRYEYWYFRFGIMYNFHASQTKICHGACFLKALETFWAHKAIFSLSVSKNGEVYMPQTSSIYKGNFCSF